SDLQKAAKLKGTDYHAARQIYTQYLEKNPRSPVMRRTNGKINQLDKKISDKKDYDALVSFCKNRQLDIFQRIDKLETYMKENPSGFYIKNAKTLMKHLQKEKKEYLAYQQMIENQREKEAQRLAAIQREKERIQSEKEKITTQLKQGSNRYKIDPNGYVTDTQTGLMWCLLDSHAKLQACMDYEAAQNYVKTLEIGGYKDWRLPSPNDLLVIFINKPYFPATGAKQYWSSEAYWKGSHEMVTIVENKGGNRWQRQQVDKGRCCSVRAVRP
ncbi:MAG: DUF1566 domain-containing protein, partial [Desulfobacula sp.]|nr:DUF1566 domain-containing protein [Desulfobacula sp.]